MMGLDFRLKQARIAAVLSVDDAVGARAAELAKARADLLVLDATGADREDFLRGFKELRQAAGTKVIVGVIAPSDLGAAARADLVVGDVPLPHPYALRLGVGLKQVSNQIAGLVLEAAELPKAKSSNQLGEKLPIFVVATAKSAPQSVKAGAQGFWLRDPKPAEIAEIKNLVRRTTGPIR